MTGALSIKRANPTMNFIDMNGTTERHKVFAGFANSGGDFYIYDNTQSKGVLVSKASGEVYVNGTSIPSNATLATTANLSAKQDLSSALKYIKRTFTGLSFAVDTPSAVAFISNIIPSGHTFVGAICQGITTSTNSCGGMVVISNNTVYIYPSKTFTNADISLIFLYV